MTARTPGPWRWDRHPHSWPNCDRPSEVNHVPILYKDDEGLDRPDPGIRVASFSDTPRHKASELATFIVEACNAHDTLTAENEALREALMDIVEIASHRWRALPHGTPEKDRLEKARAALAKDGA